MAEFDKIGNYWKRHWFIFVYMPKL